VGEVFGLVAGAVDGDGFLDGVDQPSHLNSIRDPLPHLRVHLAGSSHGPLNSTTNPEQNDAKPSFFR